MGRDGRERQMYGMINITLDLWVKKSGWEMDGTDPASCPVAVLRVSVLEPNGSANTSLNRTGN